MHPQYSQAAIDRFWSRVDKSGECWLWTGRPRADGYGQISMDGHGFVAHRVAWIIKHGPIPAGIQVCHQCDVKLCVHHLFLGTQADNVHDMHAKGRAPVGDDHYSRLKPERLSRGDRHYTRVTPGRVVRGERSGLAILTETAVREMRRLYAAGGITQMTLAVMFGTDQTNVSLIVRHRSWQHVP